MSFSLERLTLADRTLVDRPRRIGRWRRADAASRPGTLAGAVADASVRPELASLLATLMMLIDEQGSVVLHVAAATAGAGASAVAAEIAAAAGSSAWCKVALVDVHGAAGHGRVPGTGMLAAVERGEPPVLRPGQVGGAAVAVGSFDFGGNSLARIDGLRDLYGQLRASHTLVVIDGPPVLSGAGAALLGADADATILVVEAEQTRAAEITRARAVLDQVGAPVMGVVLNKSRNRVPGLVRRFL